MEIPILQLMNEIDTESIKLTDNLDLKAKPVTKTHGVTKDVRIILVKLNNYITKRKSLCW